MKNRMYNIGVVLILLIAVSTIATASRMALTTMPDQKIRAVGTSRDGSELLMSVCQQDVEKLFVIKTQRCIPGSEIPRFLKQNSGWIITNGKDGFSNLITEYSGVKYGCPVLASRAESIGIIPVGPLKVLP